MSLNNGFVNSTIVSNQKKEVDLDALNLLASGGVPEFCLCTYRNEKKHHHFAYNTQGMLALAQLQAGMTFENVIDILAAVVRMIQNMQDHNLALDNIKNAKAYIFRDDSGYKFVYLPLVHKPHLTVRDFLLKLLSVIHHKDVRLNLFVKELKKKKENAQAMAYLTAFVASYTALDDNAAYSDEEGATTVLSRETQQETPIPSEEGETTVLSRTGCPSEEGETTVLNRAVYEETPISSEEGETTVLSRTGCSSEEGETTVLNRAVYEETPMPSEEGETTVLSRALPEEDEGILTNGYRTTAFFQDTSGEYETTVLTSQPVLPVQPAREINSEYTLHLIRNLNGEKISVDVTPFAIGKDSANMDFVLNNDSVSRHHATVICENGEYFIVDNHSTNGTMVEGIRLQPEEKCEIGNGYIISLGNESFQAYIERR